MSRPGLCKSVKNPVLPSSQSLLAFTAEERKNNKRQQEKKSSLDLRTERQVNCPQVLTLETQKWEGPLGTMAGSSPEQFSPQKSPWNVPRQLDTYKELGHLCT